MSLNVLPLPTRIRKRNLMSSFDMNPGGSLTIYFAVSAGRGFVSRLTVSEAKLRGNYVLSTCCSCSCYISACILCGCVTWLKGGLAVIAAASKISFNFDECLVGDITCALSLYNANIFLYFFKYKLYCTYIRYFLKIIIKLSASQDRLQRFLFLNFSSAIFFLSNWQTFLKHYMGFTHMYVY